nr:Ada metal-binding domain-containing protein [Phenylobacterium sp.]
MFQLIGPDGQPYLSATPGTLGGHRRLKAYGRLDCASARGWIAKGHYVRHRVFFADEATAVAAGYRPCARCLRERYAAWKASAQPSSAASGPTSPGSGSGRETGSSHDPSPPEGARPTR